MSGGVTLLMAFYFQNNEDGGKEKWKTSVHLIHLKRHNHFKNRDIHLKGELIIQVFHQVGTIHFPHFTTQIATAYILVAFARLQ